MSHRDLAQPAIEKLDSPQQTIPLIGLAKNSKTVKQAGYPGQDSAGLAT